MRSVTTTGGLTRGRGMREAKRALWLLSMPTLAEYNHAMQQLTGTDDDATKETKLLTIPGFDQRLTMDILSKLHVLVRQHGVMKRIHRIRVFLKDGQWFTLDNRGLWVFRKLEENGCINDIKVICVGRDILQDSKFTTYNKWPEGCNRKTYENIFNQ
ncbi:unnamed protein product [Mytilus coruscus]|uniref:Uncharacterized protein n=1 Tax=Mytilus coruscus TaxID=42192 RepID=A0A6J8E3G9_MYTCO|nr:unnamed protein product [Mytilus coruscus]